MQSPLFSHTEQQSQDRYTVQNPQLLRVALTGHDDVLARKGAMVAYQGLMEFDGEYQSQSQARARRTTGEGLDLMRCSGQGTVYLANLAQYIHVVDVDDEGMTVDSAYVLALDSSLHTEVIAMDSQYGISGTGKYQLNISGNGKVALMTSGQPLMMQVTPDKYVNADARQHGGGEGWELSFLGQGFALVQPSEVLPPQNAQIGQGAAAQFGVGQHGAHGQNQNNAWN
ncbi:AIM24 family protein [Streptomyces sp. wa22]|uniref:AIM24 family protein n=1 Tax=Streptomyces sp. wa22 TaxID=1828244 RepID=UPI0011C7E629|nr:AIM24 family protein [Streptomyces sp. wa22]TXS17952.1 AIM24 family protein [Streptomyces sp. wa22]